MSLTNTSSGTKPKPKTTQNTNKNQQPQKQADQAHVRTSLKEQKVQIRRPTQKWNGVLNSSQAALSTGRPGQSCILLHSAYRQEGIPPTVHSVCMCMSRLKARVKCKSGSARSMRSKALHNLYQRMRARKRPCG